MTAREVLKNCLVFSGLSDAQLDKVLNLTSEKEFEAGACMFQEGDSADELFVIREGKVALQMTLNHDSGMSRSVSVDIATAGDAIGWSALVMPYVFTLRAVCLQKVKALSINGSSLRWLVDDEPDIGCQVMRGLIKLVASRLEDTRRVLVSERLLPLVSERR
ncbi:MAG: cyclic nucleotide-binding domain-containing protein [Chloroflexi bacterium]|nr:cyclic nucleotide-binding domain-containing protein [Chloroflexota bacterium]